MKKIALVVITVFNILNTNAQWSSNPAVNNAICTAFSNQERPKIVSDGSGGAIITWQDYRTLNDYDIYAQRINANGVIQWTANGVAICSLTGLQDRPAIVSDGNGGAIITWQDWRGTTSDIYAQRINASGAVQWATNGVAISTALRNQYNLNIASDGSSGAIITWQDFRSSNSEDVYAQRINGSGVVQWTADGVAISASTAPGSGNQTYPTIDTDGSGGAIISWIDSRGNASHIYAQRINASGAVQWTADGVAICIATGYQYYPTIVSDGNSGAIITWYDYGTISGNNNDIYAQRVNASGALQWTTNGVPICVMTGSQSLPNIVTDGNAGAIISWMDNRSGINAQNDIYAQRINASGTVQWTANGVPICTATDSQQWQTITSDGSGGAVITWDDYRIGSTNTNVYAQRISANGAVQWTTDGVAVTTATGSQGSTTITSDGVGGAIIAWGDSRGGAPDIYAQRIFSGGTLKDSVFEKPTIAIYPNPSKGIFTLYTDSLSALKSIAVYTVLGQQILSQDITANESILNISGHPKGIYFYTITNDNNEAKSGKLLLE